MSRPTADELVDVAETGRVGCLLPELEDPPTGGEYDEGDDDE